MSEAKSAGQTTEVTFERGYRRLQEIAEQVGSEEVPVERMCELFAEGKGLEQALVAYLEEQKDRIEAIERGEGVPRFRVIRTAGAEVADDADAEGDEVTGVQTGAEAPAASDAAQDEIPF